MSSGRAMAVFGGTFDPIHNGHLAVANEAVLALGVDGVSFMPAGQPWLKGDRDITPARHRLRMVRLAVAANPHFMVSTMEIDRPGPTYTVDTVERLRQQVGPAAELYFLVGGDGLRELPEWKEPWRLTGLCRLVAFGRPGAEVPVLDELETSVPGISANVILIDVPQVDVSSTEVRSRLRQGEPISGLVPPAVEQYIRDHRLYIDGGER